MHYGMREGVKKVMRAEECRKKSKVNREEINKSSERGKSSNHPVALYVSAYIHKTFDLWKLRHLFHPPKSPSSPSVCLSVSLGAARKRGRKVISTQQIVTTVTLSPDLHSCREGDTFIFTVYISTHTPQTTHIHTGIEVRFLSHRYTHRKVSEHAGCHPTPC